VAVGGEFVVVGYNLAEYFVVVVPVAVAEVDPAEIVMAGIVVGHLVAEQEVVQTQNYSNR